MSGLSQGSHGARLVQTASGRWSIGHLLGPAGVLLVVGCGDSVTVEHLRPVDLDAALVSNQGGDGGWFDAADVADGSGYLPGRPEVLCSSTGGAFPPASVAITNPQVDGADSLGVMSTGDLWPSCWSGTMLYAAWGDGYGFDDGGSYGRPTIGVASITGDPSDASAMSGTTLVHDDESQSVFKIWTNGPYYQKPTGMLCTPGRMFLAVQDLNDSTYGDAPAATIAVSSDNGATWTEDATAPMFDNHEFTTVMFLDYGPDQAWSVDGYIYVYGLDYNWRYSATMTSPQGLYLARVANADDVLDRTTWQYFAGAGDAGDPLWTSDFTQRLPVLVDCARRDATASFDGYTVISQGGVVYDAPRQRYLYTSWSEHTFEFYEAPSPWGPWSKFFYEDFGPPPWTISNNGGYGTTIPSKFIDVDGGSMWLQSNTWSSGVIDNNFELRNVQL